MLAAPPSRHAPGSTPSITAPRPPAFILAPPSASTSSSNAPPCALPPTKSVRPELPPGINRRRRANGAPGGDRRDSTTGWINRLIRCTSKAGHGKRLEINMRHLPAEHLGDQFSRCGCHGHAEHVMSRGYENVRERR